MKIIFNKEKIKIKKKEKSFKRKNPFTFKANLYLIK